MSAEDTDKSSPAENVQPRRSGRKRTQKKDLDTDYDYDYTNNLPMGPKVFAIYPNGKRPSANTFTPRSANKPTEVKVAPKAVNNNPEIRGKEWCEMEPPDIIDAHVEVLKRRMDFVTGVEKHVQPVEISPKAKPPQFLGSDASKYDSNESDEVAVRSVINQMVKVVCNFQPIHK